MVCKTIEYKGENDKEQVSISRMNRKLKFAVFLIFLHFLGTSLPAAGEPDSPSGISGRSTLLVERFNNLDAWEELTFPKIKQHSSYTIEPATGSNPALRADSNRSASGIVWKGEFNVYEYPKLRWRWKVRNCYVKGDATTKKGDDYPIRLYVMFKYDPSDPAVKRSLKYTLARLFYGRTPPYTSLNYIWANRDHGRTFLTNPHSKKAMMVVLQAGEEKVGLWTREDVDIVKDYQEAFGTLPPAMAGLAIMNDSDGTGESSTSWMDDLEIYRAPADFPRGQEAEGRREEAGGSTEPPNN